MRVYDTVMCYTRFAKDTRGRAYGSVLVVYTFVTIQWCLGAEPVHTKRNSSSYRSKTTKNYLFYRFGVNIHLKKFCEAKRMTNY